MGSDEKIRAAEALLKAAYEEFGDRTAIASSFGAEDMVLVDLASRVAPAMRVFTLDTGRLPEETYRLMARTRERYDLDVEVFFPEPDEVERMVAEDGINLFYDGIAQRKRCCEVRKMRPLRRAMGQLDAWVCGLRREQSPTRTAIAEREADAGNGGIAKFNPLAEWTTDELWDYIHANEVPYSELHDKGFPSIGCEPCTRAVEPGEDIRAGRWWWESPEHKECGLHARRSA